MKNQIKYPRFLLLSCRTTGPRKSVFHIKTLLHFSTEMAFGAYRLFRLKCQKLTYKQEFKLRQFLKGRSSQIHVGYLSLFYLYGLIGGVFFISFLKSILRYVIVKYAKNGAIVIRVMRKRLYLFATLSKL